ncbi:hypothetical protein HPB52_015887 [Rhipicephalus sanguineus]|uniref:Uncharacterized protein n=1 Tax=Rhipicephalus sanguineus TaxID=34632 RepID=A0A9D4TAT7_RHISA|nr:hypothetical protein HPB52_015887 [Rhipicephalus sanguineus]
MLCRHMKSCWRPRSRSTGASALGMGSKAPTTIEAGSFLACWLIPVSYTTGVRPKSRLENRSWLKAAGTVLDGPRVENKGPLFRDTREPTSTSTPTRLNDQDQPASNLTSPAAESAGSSTEPSPGLLHDSGPTLDSGPHNGDPSGQSTPQLRRSTRLRRPPDRYVP